MLMCDHFIVGPQGTQGSIGVCTIQPMQQRIELVSAVGPHRLFAHPMSHRARRKNQVKRPP